MRGWSAAIALNREWGACHSTAAGKVVIYNVEDDMHEQRRRLSAALRQFGTTPPDLKDKFIRVGPQAIGTLLERGDDDKIRFTPGMRHLEELVAALRPAALIVDPLAELHNVEENNNTALRAVIATFRALAIKYSMAVIILHHTRKGSAASPGNPDIERSASAIVGAVRVAVTLTTMSEEDADVVLLKIGNATQRAAWQSAEGTRVFALGRGGHDEPYIHSAARLREKLHSRVRSPVYWPLRDADRRFLAIGYAT